jgi:hypothetical protein
MLSDSATAKMILSWKSARLNPGSSNLGYPTENILEKAGKGRSTSYSPLPDGELTDAEMVQKVVDRMSKEIKLVFEAYHLMLIRGKRCRELPHKLRAAALGISKSTYGRRRDAGFMDCRKELP